MVFGHVGITALDAVGAAVSQVPAFSLADATHLTFAPHIGSVFRMRGRDGGASDVVLTRVTALPRHERAPVFRDPFSLAFSDARGAALLESIVDVHHERLGRFALSVHSSASHRGCIYEAVFG